MTIPRRFLPNQAHAISRRCAERRFYLRPSLESMHLLLYALGRALTDKKLALLAFSVQKDHYHVVVVDLSQPGEPSDLPRFFGHLPRLPYGVRPVPDTMAPTYTTGRYWGGDLENGVAGGYMVNTYDLSQRPLVCCSLDLFRRSSN